LKALVFRVLALGFFVYWGMNTIAMDLTINHVFAQDKVTQELLEVLTQLGKTSGSYRADITSIVQGRKGATYYTKGKFKFKWPRMLWQKNWRVKDNTLLGISISNGKFKWLYVPRVNAVLKYNKKAIDEDSQEKGWFSADVIDKASVQFVGKENIGREEVYVFEVEPSALLKHENPDPPGKSRFYIGVKDGIMRKMISYNPQGLETGSQIYTNIQLDDSITAKDFEFIPPDGTQIHEVMGVGSRTNQNP